MYVYVLYNNTIAGEWKGDLQPNLTKWKIICARDYDFCRIFGWIADLNCGLATETTTAGYIHI